MAARVGPKTSVRIGSTIITLADGWTMNGTVDVFEVTAFGSSFKDRVSGLKDWSVEVSGTLDETTGGNQRTIFDQWESGGTLADVALRCYTTTGNAPYWGGNARLTSLTANGAVGDKASYTFSFSGNGAVSYTSSTS